VRGRDDVVPISIYTLKFRVADSMSSCKLLWEILEGVTGLYAIKENLKALCFNAQIYANPVVDYLGGTSQF
jgi:hypothetical protein